MAAAAVYRCMDKTCPCTEDYAYTNAAAHHEAWHQMHGRTTVDGQVVNLIRDPDTYMVRCPYCPYESQSFRPLRGLPPTHEPSPVSCLGTAVTRLMGGLARRFSLGSGPSSSRPASLPSSSSLAGHVVDNDGPTKWKRGSSTATSSNVAEESQSGDTRHRLCSQPKTQHIMRSSDDEGASTPAPASISSLARDNNNNDPDGDLYYDGGDGGDGDSSDAHAGEASVGNNNVKDSYVHDTKGATDSQSHHDSSYVLTPPSPDVEVDGEVPPDEDVDVGEDIWEGSDAEPERVVRSSDISPLLPPLEQVFEIKRLKATVHRGDHHWQPQDQESQRVMSKARCVVDTQYRIIICTKCQYALDPECPAIMKKVRPRNRKIHYGLALFLSIIFCARYHHGFETEASYTRLHKCKATPVRSAPNAPRTYRAKAQTFFNNKKERRFFPVEYEPVNPVTNSAKAKQAWSLVKPLLIEPAFEQIPIQLPDNLRQLSVFKRREGWCRYVRGMSGEKIQAILDESRDPPAINILALYLERYVDAALYALEDESYIIQLKLANIGLRPDFKGCVRRIMTWPEYVHEFMPILQFVLRAARGDFPDDFSLPLTEVQGAFARDLMTHLENAHDTDAQPVDLEQLETNHEEKAFMNCFGEDRHIMKSLHGLLWSLVSHKKVGCDPSKFYTPLYNYLVLSSYDAQGHLKFATSISHVIAPLLFLCRVAIFVQGVLYSQEQEVPYLE
ncbi:hypothetical protein PUNSTDRAFT_45109 [Punctularia strigosozonata HHB-11173 SS5]|uniref:uncharacterized protein n=1 Tax=Punctularia strigosozonata (strain HHB-11173) TaxID=741275 RepID=UPI0004418252|nr:uncharacterized protein PUNSTDRAFT_45109 [Punctularia strigosozonata HHB-11173 SS5]EIN08680.1 hypothetical protein PUNSTDRAFT_45109 [Punctularia strigosozonata HHB-11173 SS5]